MTRKFILAEDIEDDGYNCYFPAVKEKVFEFLVDSDEYEIYVSKDYKLEEFLPNLNKYMDWFTSCKNELVEYFENKTGEKKTDDWFKTVEVYNIAMTFNSPDDFGATVTFGENTYEEQIYELNFDKFEITDDSFEG